MGQWVKISDLPSILASSSDSSSNSAVWYQYIVALVLTLLAILAWLAIQLFGIFFFFQQYIYGDKNFNTLVFWLTLLAVLAILAIQLFAIQLCSIASTELCEHVLKCNCTKEETLEQCIFQV